MCSPSLSEGMSTPKAVGLPLVEKDRVLRGCILSMCGEEKGGIPFRPDVGSLGVQGSGTFWLEGMRHIVKSC
jgi:hypothetical protein